MTVSSATGSPAPAVGATGGHDTPAHAGSSLRLAGSASAEDVQLRDGSHRAASIMDIPQMHKDGSHNNHRIVTTGDSAGTTNTTMIICGVVAVVAVLAALVFSYRVLRKRELSRAQSLEAELPATTKNADHTVGFAALAEGKHKAPTGGSEQPVVLMMEEQAPEPSEESQEAQEPARQRKRNDTFQDSHFSINNDSEQWDDPIILSTRIPALALQEIALIGQGRHTQVFRGMYSGHDVAIKRLLPSFPVNHSALDAFIEEIQVAAVLSHPQLVQFVGVAWNDDRRENVALVTEFMAGGDLRAVISRFAEQGRPCGFDVGKCNIALQMLQGLRYLHSLSPVVLHRNFKSSNILVNDRMEAKLSDIGGLVQHQWSSLSSMATTGSSPSLWMAPEVVIGGQYDESADMFSFGVILSELDTQALPYAQAQTSSGSSRRLRGGLSATDVLRKVALGKLTCQFSSNLHPGIAALGRACLVLEPANRPAAAEAMIVLQSIARSIPSMSV